MSGPNLTPDEIAQMQKEAAKASAASQTFAAQVVAQQARAQELAKVDSGFKKFFDYYDTDIIGKYDLERRAINGQYVDTPIVESDIVACASLAGGRLQPSLPATDVIRIPQFDGSPLLTDASNELQFILDQAQAETTLVSGYGGTSPAITIVTSTAITPTSTTLQLTDPTTTFSIAPNSVFVISSGGDLAVIKIVTFTLQVSPAPPPYIADCTIELLVPPTGTIAAGQTLTAFNGFTNGERTTKTASNPQLQGLMDYLILQLQNKINERIGKLNDQLTAISGNQDPDGISELNTATTNVNSSKTFLTNYLITTDISNTGLAGLSTERGTRTTQANNRVSQIVNAYTGRTKNYYNERYNAANNRANTSRGSLRLQKAAEQVADTSQAYAQGLSDQAEAISSILP